MYSQPPPCPKNKPPQNKQFLGAGSYYQNDPISSLIYGKQNVDRAVFFEGVPDPEILKVRFFGLGSVRVVG